jgi:thiamine-phosphate pyrophosphorylase
MAMRRRQTNPRQWLIVRGADDREGIAAARRLPRGSGVLLLKRLPAREMRKLRLRGSNVVQERRGSAARVHDVRELRRALMVRTPLIFLSPLYPTASHPEWRPIPRMRAAALARLADRGLVALGGMDERRFRRVRRWGFIAWAGIGAWLKFTNVTP